MGKFSETQFHLTISFAKLNLKQTLLSTLDYNFLQHKKLRIFILIIISTRYKTTCNVN